MTDIDTTELNILSSEIGIIQQPPPSPEPIQQQEPTKRQRIQKCKSSKKLIKIVLEDYIKENEEMLKLFDRKLTRLERMVDMYIKQ